MSPDAPAIAFESLSKVYRVYAHPRHRLYEALTGRPRHTAVHALRDVSATVPKGAVLGIVGENGAGKSTLLKILAGTTAPSSGSLSVRGRVASILELGSSFHPEVSGRRNVVMQAALSGLSAAETEAALPEIEAFAELGPFFDRLVKTYSSGMQMRLAFAVATAVLPDVVILDEALAVGDGHFQKKCVERIHALRASGRTILFCSHSMHFVTTLCDHAVWLRHGAIAATGESHEVALEYEHYLAKKDRERAVAPVAPPSGTPGHFTQVRLVGADGAPRDTFRPGEPWVVEVSFESEDPAHLFHVHVGVATRDQVNCFAADSRWDGVGPFRGRRRYHLRVSLPALPLAKGEFEVHAYLADERALAIYDTRADLSFRVASDSWRTGLMDLRAQWTDRDAEDAAVPAVAGDRSERRS